MFLTTPPRLRDSLFGFAVLLLPLAVAARADDAPFTPSPIQVPDGMVVELAAAPPLVAHPMMAGFDDRGRLFIAESAGLNLKREELEASLPNFIRMLEDTDEDGVFDRSTIFAGGMTLPQGALWHEGALYVAAPPSIWRLEDTDGDGVADRRDEIVNKFGYTGNAASVHGCFLGPTGRIYWCDGRHGHEFQTADGKIVSQGKAARIFSCRPDGSDVQVHCGGGMDNPVEIDFTPEGEMLGTVNLLFRQRGDCLVHWMHGGVYPRYDQEPCIAEFKSTGDLLPPVYNLGHVAVSGTCQYRGEHLGSQYLGNFFICEFNTHKISRATLTRDGSTFRATVEDFLVAGNPDFHPTDVLEDADGSLLVIDTGGWFRIGCPTSQIAKPNILGAIYRVRRSDGPRAADPRGKMIAWDTRSPAQLVELLGDPRNAVRRQAKGHLARRGDASLPALRQSLANPAEQVRREAVWTLSRIDTPAAREVIRGALDDSSDSVRQAAAHAAGVVRDPMAAEKLIPLLETGPPQQRREVATSLGRLRAARAVPALLQALGQDVVDRMLEHAVIYALIEIDDRQQTLAGLNDASPRVRRGALIALDQMDHGELTRQLVAPLLDTADFALQRTALEVVQRHPGWGDEIVQVLSRLLEQPKLSAEQQTALSGSLIAFCRNAEVQQLLSGALARDDLPAGTRLVLLDVFGRCGLETLPESWWSSLAASLAGTDPVVVQQAIATTASLGTSRLDESLWRVARDEAQSDSLRVAALEVLASHQQPLDALSFALLARQFEPDSAPMQRLAAARALGNAALERSQLSAAVRLVENGGPLELAPLLAAFEHAKAPDVGKELVGALSRAPGLTSLSATQLRQLLSAYPRDVQDAGKSLLDRLTATTAEQAARLANLEQQLAGGDAARGREVFRNERVGCIACHRVGNDGGAVGPELSTIGQSRTGRDLIEAVVLPSASLARGFETYSIMTEDGRVFSGLITRETAAAIQLRTTQQTETRIARDQIEQMVPNPISIMPTGLENTMTADQLRDLVAYLQSLK